MDLLRLVCCAIAGLWFLSPLLPVTAQPSQQDTVPTVVDLTLLDLDYFDQRFRQDGASAGYNLYMPKNFQLREESYLEIVYSSFLGSQSLTLPAELKVSLNNVLVDRIALPRNRSPVQGLERRVRVPLSGTPLRAGYNRLEIELDTSSICGSYEPQLEVLIYATSNFHLVYDIPPLDPNLQSYPYPFYERTFQPSQVYIVLPREPSSADLSAAATISAGLGRASQVEGRLAITSTLDILLNPQVRDNYNLIVIGQAGRYRLLDQLPLDNPSAETAPDDGVLEIMPSPWNAARAVLIVTGQSDLALYRASAALNRPSFLPGLRGRVSVVKDVLPAPPTTQESLVTEKTFDRLGYQDETLYGIVERRQRYSFILPRAWESLETARLHLFFAHSSIIDPANSTLDVLLNSVPIGGTLLDESNQTDGLLELELPNWLLKPGSNRLDIKVEMHLFDEYCLSRDDSRAWTVIFKNSYLHLPLATSPVTPDIADFPTPFDRDGHYDETSLVVPDRMNAQQRNALMRLAVYLGTSSESDYIALQALRASEVSDETKNQQHLILIGQPTRNALLQEPVIANALPQPFEPGTDTLVPRHDTVVVQQAPEWSLGLLQMLPSPWNLERSILVVTGTTGQGVVLGLQALVSSSESLTGNLAAVDAEGIQYALDTNIQEAQQASPDSTSFVRASKDRQWWTKLAEKWW